MSGVYYNEIDPFAVSWLRELIKAGQIAPGEVDERDIKDIVPSELTGFTQCHFFAGIGVWSYALRQAGWPDDRPVWTGSCPCQPFSAAGKRKGVADERHLWPAFHWLISICHPVTVLGEQVAGKDGLNWLGTVQADLENADYSFGAVDLCAAGFGAPHIRQRLYFVADSGQQPQGRGLLRPGQSAEPGDSSHPGLSQRISDRRVQREAMGTSERKTAECTSDPGGLEHTESGQVGLPGCTWFDGRTADWIACRDGKSRPVEPGTFPLAHGAANRVGRLRGYGNALCAPVAQGFIEAVMEILG